MRIPKPAINWNTFVYLLATSFLVSCLALINRYPFVYSDSGAYIRSAFTLIPIADRPIGYSLIIRAVTWQSTLWTVALFQGFMTSWSLYELLKQLLPEGVLVRRVHLLLIAVLVVCSSMPWYMAQIMPDALTPLLIILLFLWLEGEGLNVYKRAFIWVCVFFFLIAHYSHVAMAGLFLAGTLVHWLISRRKSQVPGYLARWAGMAGAVVGSVLFAMAYNASHGFRPVLSPSANVFFTGRLCEEEILHDFLVEHCGERGYPICPFMNELPERPGDFIWGDQSIVNRSGWNMAEADTILAPMVHDLLSEPEYLGRYARSAFVGTIVQLFQVSTNTGIVSFYRDSAPYSAVTERLPWEAGSYIHPGQAYNGYKMEFVDRVVRLALLVSLLIMGWLWYQPGTGDAVRRFGAQALAWVVLNAAVTSSLANIYDRLQSRVTWLVVLVACLLLMRSAWGQRMMRKHATV